jgi:hypothetical protein
MNERVKIGESGRQYTVRTNRHGIDYVLGRLREKKTVKTLALFWRIPHQHHADELSLKVGRYRRVAGEDVPEIANPKSELTLDSEELKALQQFISDNVEPLSSGATDYMVLDDEAGRHVELLRRLLSDPDQDQVLDVLTRERLVPEDLRRGLEYRARCAAVDEFVRMLDRELTEADWQRWFQANDWVLGSDFVRIIDERPIDVRHIADYLMEGYDGFLDVVELKRPAGGLRFWAQSTDHGNPVPHGDLVKAITQSQRYLFEVEREANSVKFAQRVGVLAVKPRCTLIFGRSNRWTEEQRQAYRILNAGFHSLSILTYDHVLARARRMLGLHHHDGRSR